MRRSKVDITLHFVWATWRREPLLGAEVERAVYRSIEEEAQSLGCAVVAIGGTENHVHLVVRSPATASPARVMQRVKGVSSMTGRELCGETQAFGWQDRYGVLSVSHAHLPR